MIRLGSFAIDPRTWLLTGDGRPIDLSPRLVEILAYIVARDGEIVTKDELLDRFWPDVHVTENTLTRAIADIRKAIKDDAAEPKYLQTVSRRGYRFIAGVTASRPAAKDGSRSEPEATGADPFQEWVKGRLALDSLDAAKLDDAVRAFERTAAELPRYAPAHAGLANAYLLRYETTRSGRQPNRELLDRAMTAAQDAAAIDPTLGEAWAVLGYALSAAGRTQEGQAAARRATALEPDNWRHHYRLAHSVWGEERLRAVDRTLALMPGFAPARMLSCMVFVARGTIERAEREAASGAEAQRQRHRLHTPLPAVGLHWLLGIILRATRRIDQALACFDEEIAEASGHVYGGEFVVNAQVAAGFTLLSQENTDGAAAAFTRALDVSPGHPKASVGRYALARRLAVPGEIALARGAAETAIAELRQGDRHVEAALVAAGMKIADDQAADALNDLDHLLETAPPGPAGWIIPVDPMLAAIRETARNEALFSRLAARAV